jgi:hypothetical protein
MLQLLLLLMLLLTLLFAAFVVVVAALYAVAFVEFTTFANAGVDAIVPVAAASGVFIVAAKPNVTDD